MLQNVSAEALYFHERARQAREKADAATADQARSAYLAAEARWLSLAHSHELQLRFSEMLGDKSSTARATRAFDPEVVAVINSALSAVFVDLGLSDREDTVAFRAARRIINLAYSGEHDPQKIRKVMLSWVTE
jgi:hypothetical protein